MAIGNRPEQARGARVPRDCRHPQRTFPPVGDAARGWADHDALFDIEQQLIAMHFGLAEDQVDRHRKRGRLMLDVDVLVRAEVDHGALRELRAARLFGPGYETDLYEIDESKLAGTAGEPVDLGHSRP